MAKYKFTELRESRALPGGKLDSKEKTEYENWLEKKTKENDKKREGDSFKTYGYMKSDCGENGYHDDEGEPIKLEDYPKIFQEIYDKSNN